jgi:alcohol dehydrogenase class IV
MNDVLLQGLSHATLRGPRHLVFGVGQRAVLGEHVAALGRRALVITDARMAADPLFAAMRAAIEAAGAQVTVFDGVEPELPVECIVRAVEAGRGVDVVVGIGGGSCLDAAKCAAVLLTHGGTPADYYGEYRVPGPVTPLVAVPTTSGTGSEVTPVAVLADPGRAVKIGIASPHLIPTVAICDPELTLSCPPGLTAVSGADALAHAIEAYTTLRRPPSPRLTLEHAFIGKNPLCDLLALEAVRRIGRSLERAVETGSDQAARADMMLGSTLAGLAFGTAGTAAAHAIQYPVGALTHTAHGLGVAALLPYVMAYNRPACEAEFAEIGAALGLPATGATAARADAAIEGVAALFARIGIPPDLRALGVGADDLDDIGRLALGAERLIKNNPRPLTPETMAGLVRAAFDGRRDALAGPSREATP